ncbi:MAG: type II toxin-antitoxin system RelE/ParE family toxin [Candidatus Borkfalkiaceae bacterium]|nr:type II toxin-antitoxin system RelE/ParE family toxin [Clostridia bacterium]MDY6223117.1 type II toxin-antitoxin system RelE/ParE family toxin [Christensenellaceae bacterium]
MVFKCRFTEKAGRELEDILQYISEDLCNVSAAASFGKKVFENIDALCSFPERGVLVQNDLVADKTVRRLVIDNYLLYYKIDETDSRIDILRIVYGKMNLEEIYRQF